MGDENKPKKSMQKPVGYGRPPEHTRFRKGQSGNPKGRPKGTIDVATVLKKSLLEKTVIVENGRHKTVTKLEAALKQLVNLATTGELRAIQLLSALARSVEEPPDQQSGQQAELGDADQKVLDNILRRFSMKSRGGDENEPHNR
jgi:uncharacterized protein DUF5681